MVDTSNNKLGSDPKPSHEKNSEETAPCVDPKVIELRKERLLEVKRLFIEFFEKYTETSIHNESKKTGWKNLWGLF